MKYAFIALIAIYLVIYGCSPDESEKPTNSHEQTAPALTEHTEQGDKVAVPEHQQEVVVPVHEGGEKSAVAEEPAAADEKAEQAQPVAHEQQPSAEEEQVVTPCGRKMAKADIPADAPCMNMQNLAQEIQSAATSGNTEELAAAMQKIVEATDNMILATRQLVMATQQMLDFSTTEPAEESAGEQTPTPSQQ